MTIKAQSEPVTADLAAMLEADAALPIDEPAPKGFDADAFASQLMPQDVEAGRRALYAEAGVEASAVGRDLTDAERAAVKAVLDRRCVEIEQRLSGLNASSDFDILSTSTDRNGKVHNVYRRDLPRT